MSSVASSLGTCNPRKLRTFSTLPPKNFNAPKTSRIKILSQAQKSSPCSENVLQLNNEKPSLLRRREAIGFGFCFGLVDVLLPAQPTEAAEVAPCEFTVAPSGLAFCDKVVGKGAEAVKGQMIKAHYTGKLENGKVFDSSYNRGKPLSFRIGAGEVIKGWDQGILGGDGIPPMLAGGKRTLKIPAELAYGARGAGCRGGSCIIPPYSVLLFDVEFIGKA
ncbi:putative peptidylprolyl isomerase [Rosa chinensis]|uniref:peptidylprolyl isomerase n=1 Tax=Rosa chinensis TaxID=74649 RepID=A0A2P6Q7K9_ROSCH|nr:peptidyl-prolyl cis-trans isomerase FKBP13, chloroplastic isoform X2 [Rosa chinensis]PRQ30160.1 putative peptidylprolyl isomerase [Rosa chinensis]